MNELNAILDEVPLPTDFTTSEGKLRYGKVALRGFDLTNSTYSIKSFRAAVSKYEFRLATAGQ